MRKLLLLFALVAPLTLQPVAAKLNVLACEPEWAALLQELGGDEVSVSSATTAQQDPHRIEPRPSLIARMRRAELLVCTGAELEIGWLPVLLQQAGRTVQPGQPGYFEAAGVVALRDKPASLDRAQGDVHAAGNPHIHTDPRNIARVAQALTERLVAIDGRNADHYRARHADFARRWHEAIARWEVRAAPLRGMSIVVHHKDWVYLEGWLGLQEAGMLEARPGVPPSTTHLAGLLARLQQTPAKVIIRAHYQDARASQWLAERANLPAVALPYTVGGSDAARDLFSLFDVTIQTLLQYAA